MILANSLHVETYIPHVLMSNKMIRGSVKISGKLGKIRIRLSDYLVLCNEQNNLPIGAIRTLSYLPYMYVLYGISVTLQKIQVKQYSTSVVWHISNIWKMTFFRGFL